MQSLRILVGCKRVIDYAVRVRVNPAQTAIIKANVKHSLNPFDEIAVEESLRIRERHPNLVKDIVAVSVGGKACTETLKTALAMGVDRAIHVELASPEQEEAIHPLDIARIFKKLIENENETVDLVMLGKQAIDDDAGQTGQMLAALLAWPQATFISSIDLNATSTSITVMREVDTGLEKLECKLPAVVTTDLRLNEPRYATLQNIMKAKGKTITKFSLEDLGVTLRDTLKTIKVEEPAKRKAGVMVASVDELLEKLRNEAKVL